MYFIYTITISFLFINESVCAFILMESLRISIKFVITLHLYSFPEKHILSGCLIKYIFIEKKDTRNM